MRLLVLLHLASVLFSTMDGSILGGVELVYEVSGVNSSANSNNYASLIVSRYVPSKSLLGSKINTSEYVYFNEYVTETAVVVKVDSILDVVNHTSVVTQSLLQIESNLQMKDKSANPDLLELQLYVFNTSPVTSYGTVFDVNLKNGMQANYGQVQVNSSANSANIFDSITVVDGRKRFSWEAGNISASTGYLLVIEVEPAGDYGKDLAYKDSFEVSVTYYTNAALSSGFKVGPIVLDICVKRKNDVEESLLYQHGFTALSFFMALILGVIIVIGGVFIWFMIGRRSKKRRVGDFEHEVIIHEKGDTLILNADIAIKKHHTITDYSRFKEDESIVGVLGLKDNLERHRELDNLDIVSTAPIDQNLEEERNDASNNLTLQYVQALALNKDISPAKQEQVLSNHKKRKIGLLKNLDDEEKNEQKKLLRKISAKNRAKMSRLQKKQKTIKKKIFNENKNMSDEEKKELGKIVNEEQQTEQNEEAYRLKLEQDEEMENLRKEFEARKRMGMKELQQNLVNDVSKDLTDEKVNWLIQNHQDSQRKLEDLYDAEISKQRMLLEERLEKRRALAKMSEQTEDDMKEELNVLASGQVELITKAQSQKVLDSSEAKDILEKAKKDMLNLKDKMDADRSKEEAELHKKLSMLKKQRLDKLKQQQQMEMDEYERKNNSSQTDSPVDPVSYMEGKVQLQSKHREELHKENNLIDKENADELMKLRDSISTQTEEQLEGAKKGLINSLRERGMTDSAIKALMRKHQADMDRLHDIQADNLRRQKETLKAKLAKNREQWEIRNAQEKQEQAALREREDKIIDKLITGQMVMSDKERDEIMREHEKQMVRLENNLTLNKLHQKRMLEEKLQQKRLKQMQKLDEKHEKEVRETVARMEHNGEESDDESHKEKLKLLERQFQEKLAILHGHKLNIDEELENVKIEMLKERALALKDQEERLGAMVAAQQMSKAKELAKIDEQQKAINNLKSNLMDDLSERGIIDNKDCHEIIQRYHEEQNMLQQKIDDEQKKQEKMFKKKLKQKLEKREKSILIAQQQEMQEVLGGAKNKAAATIKRALLLHKQTIAMEQMRNRLQREIKQSLEEMRRKYEIHRMRMLQNQELDFVKKLVSFGGFPKEELAGVLQLLFPTKTDEELSQMLERIYDPKAAQQVPSIDLNASTHSVSLKDRIQMSAIEEQQALASSRQSKKTKGKKKKYIPEEDEIDGQEYFSQYSKRPDPIGQPNRTNEDDYIQAQQRPVHLPPLETEEVEKKPRKKKKKKFLKKLAHPTTEENIYDADELL